MSPRRAGRRPSGLESVLGAIARTAARLCEATDALIHLVEGDRHRLVAKHGALAHFQRLGDTHAIRRDTPLGRAVLDRRPVHIRDVPAAVRGRFRGLAELRLYNRRIRTIVVVPLLRNGAALGGIVIRRTRARPFTPRQIALLKTFADQAAIAIENARLSEALETRNRELTDALEQQTATSGILRVISGSLTDVQPVFDTIIATAVRLCGAQDGTVFQFDGQLIHVVAHHILAGDLLETVQRVFPRPPGRGSVTARAILTRAVTHVPDIAADPEYEHGALVQTGSRTVLSVPMLKDGQPIGAITVTRRAVRPFSESQIALLNTFSDQAVIAIENVRLFTELQARNRDLTEALEQQTATSEILRAISRSPTDVQPVLDTIAEHAARLCDAMFASVYRFDGELIHMGAQHNYPPSALERSRQFFPAPPTRRFFTGRAVLERAIVHVPDTTQDRDFVQDFLREAGFRSVLSVPMLRNGDPVGAITVWRATAGSFSGRQIALLQTFADQAVIAIENVRLLTELQSRNRELTDALEQQTATGEILRVISSSPTDVRPVFDAIVRSASTLCGGQWAIAVRFDGERLHLAAHHNARPGVEEAVEHLFPRRPGRELSTARAVLEKATVHIPDAHQDPDFDQRAATAQLARSFLAVPLLRAGSVLGAIGVSRTVPGRFSERHVELLQTFADQAVIAIENVRLFTELRERNRDLTETLEQQTATSEILRVISSSPGDLAPVFETILANGIRLCEAQRGILMTYDGDMFRTVAHRGLNPEALAYFLRPGRPGPLTGLGRMQRERQPVHIPDILDDPAYAAGDPERLTTARLLGARTVLWVPIIHGTTLVGALVIYREEVRPFAGGQIALLQTFADQAVIAIENARLLTDLRTRTLELGRSVEQLRALGEVGQAVSSTLDLDAVLQAIVTRAAQLAGTRGVSIWEYDEPAEVFRLRATNILDPQIAEILRAAGLRKGEGALGRAALTRAPVQIPDVGVVGAYEGPLRDALLRAGGGSVLTLPLLHEDRLLGGLTVSRRVTGEFPPDVVALLMTFAAQSAIALQHARLFRELEAKSRELEVASRHKSQFLANMSHELRTPLNAILGYGEMMADGIYGELPEAVRDVLGRVDASGRYLLGLINDVLDLSKIEAGQLVLTMTEYSIEEVVQSVVASVEALATAKNLVLAVDLAPDLPTGRGDQRRLAQVLLNLVGNAIKFTEEGGVGVQVTAPNAAFEVSVRDTGPGIAPADQERIFEEFQQADTATTRPRGGTGLGLAIARRIVAMHGGRLWVESAPGEGSTFRFTVPVQVERQAAVGAGGGVG